MRSEETYARIFAEALGLESVESDAVKSATGWDSIAHMGLVAAMEDAFGIELEPDDIMEMTTYEKTKSILSKYGVKFG